METVEFQPVARKFQSWAETLPPAEQETLATWLQKVGGDEIQGYASFWWQAPDAFCDCFLECC